MVKIRLQKLGRRNRAFFRIVVADVRVKRQGAYLEKLGQYDPIETSPDKQVVVDVERYKHWISKGAQATEAVENLVRKFGDKQVAPAAKAAKAATPAPAAVAPAAPAAPAKK
jgi:small subunit ribosomal protein S16